MKSFEECLTEVRRQQLGSALDFEDVSPEIQASLVFLAWLTLKSCRWLEAHGMGS
jgi:hypothetical protein